MMMAHTGTLWHYLASFVLYTGLAIGVIYAVYFYLRKHGGTLWNGPKKPASPAVSLEIESSLPLEPRKTLYVVRAGQERFLIATAAESTQVISRLETPTDPTLEESDSVWASQAAVSSDHPAKVEAKATPQAGPLGQSGQRVTPSTSPGAIDLPPWYTQQDAPAATDPRATARPGVHTRLMQSVQWLIASRSRS